MSLMLPSVDASGPRIQDVLPTCFRALGVGEGSPRLHLPTSTSVVLVVVDGLGLYNLDSARAHAPFLRSALSHVTPVQTVFPSTTVTALASLATGVAPGSHGMLGYVVRDPDTGNRVNQLNGLDTVADIDAWLATPTLASLHRQQGVDSSIVGLPRFVGSPLTRVIHAGMTYLGAQDLAERCDVVASEVSRGVPLVLLYIPELDQTGHALGWQSDQWHTRLETVDGELRRLRAVLPPSCAMVVTADHGMVDVASGDHLDLGTDFGEWDGVTAIGGEPRGLQLYLDDPAETEHRADEWRDVLGERAWVTTRDDLSRSGVWSDGTMDVLQRAGDILVIARKGYALYDGRDPSAQSRGMRGQHGGLSAEELTIPWLPLLA